MVLCTLIARIGDKTASLPCETPKNRSAKTEFRAQTAGKKAVDKAEHHKLRMMEHRALGLAQSKQSMPSVKVDSKGITVIVQVYLSLLTAIWAIFNRRVPFDKLSAWSRPGNRKRIRARSARAAAARQHCPRITKNGQRENQLIADSPIPRLRPAVVGNARPGRASPNRSGPSSATQEFSADRDLGFC